jgi:hypothetical protein
VRFFVKASVRYSGLLLGKIASDVRPFPFSLITAARDCDTSTSVW